jgi:hypothetical protein
MPSFCSEPSNNCIKNHDHGKEHLEALAPFRIEAEVNHPILFASPKWRANTSQQVRDLGMG